MHGRLVQGRARAHGLRLATCAGLLVMVAMWMLALGAGHSCGPLQLALLASAAPAPSKSAADTPRITADEVRTGK